MRVQIAARHCEVPERVRERTHKQLERLTRYDPRLTAADVVFSEEKHLRKVEVILHIDRAEPVVAKADGPEFRASLDKVVERLGKILRRNRDRVRDHQSPPLAEGVASE